MCRIEKRVYISPDGNQSIFDETFLCERGRRHKRTCSDTKVHTTKYRTGSSSHDPTSSPMSSPNTPGGSGFHVRERRPSTSSRPSTRDGTVKVKPEVVIEIGSKKGKGKGYPTITISTKKNHRTSLGSSSVNDSPGSDASQTIRTGYPDATLPLNSTYGALHSRPGQYRNPSSDESSMGPGRVAPIYHTSDEYDTPSLATGTTATSSRTRPVIHHAPRHVPSPIDTKRAQSGSSSSTYRTTVVTPRGVYDQTRDRTDRSQRSAASYASESTGRDEQDRRQEARDHEVAKNVMREENKRVHFESSRAQGRAEQRADKTFAERAEGREQLRQQERRIREAQASKEAAAKEAALKEAAAKRPKPTMGTSKPAAPSRRNSIRMTSAEAAKQQQLIDAEKSQMRKERINAESMEREKQMQQQQYPPTLQQQQQDPRYYDPRGNGAISGGTGSMSRRNSLSGSAQRPDMGSLGRTPSTRGTGVPQPRQERRQPPVSYYNRTDLPPARERRTSSSYGNGPTNPFASQASTADPWDVRNMRDALPSARGPQVGHNFSQPQQASHRMNQAFYNGPYEPDSEDELYSLR